MNERPDTTFICAGPSSIAIFAAGAIVFGALGFLATPALFVAAMMSALLVFFGGSTTIIVSDTAVDISLAARFLGTRIPLDTIESCDATRYHGWSRGYRVGPGIRKWVVRGGPALSIVADGQHYLASATSPESICEEIRRRQHLSR